MFFQIVKIKKLLYEVDINIKAYRDISEKDKENKQGSIATKLTWI